ncbi:hypothetical protein ACFL6Q_04705 [Candidatus Neomarinimicrobiota bacterium]
MTYRPPVFQRLQTGTDGVFHRGTPFSTGNFSKMGGYVGVLLNSLHRTVLLPTIAGGGFEYDLFDLKTEERSYEVLTVLTAQASG